MFVCLFVRLFVCSFVRLFGARGSPRGLKNNSFVRLFVCFCSISRWTSTSLTGTAPDH